MMRPEEHIKWFLEELLPDLVKKGQFSENGESQTIDECRLESVQNAIDSFASVPRFARLKLKTAKGAESRDIIIKFQVQDPIFREIRKMVPQFRNEVAMYNEVLPAFFEFLATADRERNLMEEIVPKCYFASNDDDDPEKSLLILEDLRKRGYRSAESLVELDLDHCKLALKQLAKFHAVSFAMKFRNWSKFERLKKSFVDVWTSDDPLTRQVNEEFKKPCASRGIDYLLTGKESEVPKEYLESFRKRLEESFGGLKSLNSPREPLSVICHGDFNRNNILFSYADGTASQAKLIDFQTFLYGSPCLDLTFFIYMNTTLEFRENHFDHIFDYYHAVLTETTSSILDVPEEEIRSWIPANLFRKDFARVAIQAYITVAFFLPIMMAPGGDTVDDSTTKTLGQMAEEIYHRGGESVSKRIAEVIVDFYRRKFYL